MNKRYSTSFKLKREELERLKLQGNLVRKQNAEIWALWNKLLSENNLSPETHFPKTRTGIDGDDFVNDMRTIIITAGSL